MLYGFHLSRYLRYPSNTLLGLKKGIVIVRTPINPHAFDEVRLREEMNQKVIDRFTTYEIDTRQRVDTLIKSIFLLSGGALTISIGVFLRNEAPQLPADITQTLEWAWYLLFSSLATSSLVLFVMIIQGYYVNSLWAQYQKTGENKLETSCLLKSTRIINWVVGVGGFVAFLVGLGLLAVVSVKAVNISPNQTPQPTSALMRLFG